jgi:peroxiredoxin (alkyl hydroperoxide reductase subunit C)
MAVLEPGSPAPEFTLKTEDGEAFTRADLEGQTTVLVFYPFAFSPVCNDQLTVYETVLDEFRAQGATAIYAVSCDAGPAQAAFREKLGSSIPQLSDFEPKGAASRAFGVLHPAGMSERALVVIGPDAVVRWSHQAENPGVLPGANLVFDGLAAAAA